MCNNKKERSHDCESDHITIEKEYLTDICFIEKNELLV